MQEEDELSFLTYRDGKYLDISISGIPKWILNSLDADEVIQTDKLAKQGALLTQNCIGGLQVWKLVDEFYIEYHDGDAVIGRFVITNLRDMMAFEAAFVSPVTQKLMAEHQYSEWLKMMDKMYQAVN